MTTTFKVVEFYRKNTFNTNTSTISNSSLLNASTNGFNETIQSNSNENNLNLSNSIHNTLGFNVIGGYLTNLPATVVDLVPNSNGKSQKVEEGDIILEINGLSTKHLTLEEVCKQLRCCGNRVLLKLKSDQDYKLRLKQLLNDQDSFKLGENNLESRVEDLQKLIGNNLKSFNENNKNSINGGGTGCYLLRNASKSYDNNINYAQYSNGKQGYLNLSHSITSSNVSSAANSHSNILDGDEPTISSSFNKLKQSPIATSSSLVTLSIRDSHDFKSLNSRNQDIKTEVLEESKISTESTEQASATPITSKQTNEENSLHLSSTSSSSPSSSSSLPLCSNELLVSSSSSSTSSSSSSTLLPTPSSLNEQTSSNTLPLISTNNLLLNQNDDSINTVNLFDNNSQMSETNVTNAINTINSNQMPVLSFQIEIDDSIKKRIDEKLKECSSGDSDSDNELNSYTPKAVDLPSAQRLAKRLYYLDGFKASDVVRHLSKKNDFSQLVADEYLKLFNFQSLTLDCALRKFLKQFQLDGDAQEKERVLMYFAKRYVDANNTTFSDVDSCHTLTCAIMLLNTDLHDSKIQNKMTLVEFIENLKGLNNGANFPEVLLESLYSAIKNEPLECACLDGDDHLYEDRNGSGNGNFSLRPIGSNPFLQIPDPQTAKEFKFGWLLRKCCIDSEGKKAPFLRRSWKMFYASLRDMVLYLHKDDKVFKNNTFDNITNAIRIHHAFASVATDYKKKQFVFRLKTADWAEFLFQTSNSNELFDWVSTINLVAAMFSSPPLSGGIGSSKTFQRPLLPVSNTRYTLQEQFEYHKKHLKQLQSDLAKQESAIGASLAFQNANNNNFNPSKEEKVFDKDKYNYLQFEVQRYQVYTNMLEEKLITDSALNSTVTIMPQLNQLNLVNPSFIDSTNINQNFNHLIPTNQNNYLNHHHHLHHTNNLNSFNNLNDTNQANYNLAHLKSNATTHIQTNQNLHVNFNANPNESSIPVISVTPTSIVNSKKFNNYLD